MAKKLLLSRASSKEKSESGHKGEFERRPSAPAGASKFLRPKLTPDKLHLFRRLVDLVGYTQQEHIRLDDVGGFEEKVVAPGRFERFIGV